MSNKEDLITRDELKKLFKYNPDTGELIRLVSTNNRNKIGDSAGCTRSDSYRVIRINKIQYLEHRIIWMYMYGKFPENAIDHIDGNPSNNKILNLREATNTQNSRSRNVRKAKSGYRGIAISKGGKFQVTVAGKYLGTFLTSDEANLVAEKYAKNIFGESYSDLD